MRKSIRVLWAGIAIAQLAAFGARAASTYQLDNGSVKSALNASEGTEPEDNWFANQFVAVGNQITQVVTGYFTAAANSVGDVVIYRQGALGYTRIYTQQFTPQTGNGTNYFTQTINLTNAVSLSVGDHFLVAIFEPNVIGASPNDKYPYLIDTGTVPTGSFWDRATPGTFNLDNITGAVGINQALTPGGWQPGTGNLFIRANGTVVPEPSVFALGGLAVFVMAMFRRRAK
jgi:transcriptional regulator CtsR